MTKASEVTVSDAEVEAVIVSANIHPAGAFLREELRRALAAFLAARVPDAWKHYPAAPVSAQWVAGHNKLRDAVLRGPG